VKCSDDKLLTPIYLKTAPDTPLPQDEPVYYMLSRDGLFLCRNHQFFQSSVPVERWPSELAGHEPFLRIKYPKLPRRLLERVVGFFAIIGERFQSEAAVLLAWDEQQQRLEVIVPDQCGVIGLTLRGEPYPISLDYETPLLPPHLMLIGDIHSHVDGPAYASSIDKHDEAHRSGLHFVVGRIDEEPPEIYCEVSLDGTRFRIRNLDLVLAGYHRRRKSEVPQAWLDKVTVKSWDSARRVRDYHGAAEASQHKPWGVVDVETTPGSNGESEYTAGDLPNGNSSDVGNPSNPNAAEPS